MQSTKAGRAYAFFEGIEGSVTIPGREGSVFLYKFEHSVDRSTPNGFLNHGAIQFMTKVEKSTVLLIQNMALGSTIPKVKIDFYNPLDNSLEYQMLLKRVTVSLAEKWIPDTIDGQFDGHDNRMFWRVRR